MKKYIHKVQYYETDKMGITHHSNYIRWMEEARIYFLEQIGFEYSKLEREGIISPVIGIECEYKTATTFDNEIEIDVKVKEFKGVRLIIEYTMLNIKTGDLVAICISKHCFVNKEGKPIALKKENQLLADALSKLENK
ncbi:MAG: acyl-CoA thioesterase [Clostridiales bacterium]|nr:acyl-CoA thioesterase [Clostridiales bacterium]